MKKAKKSKLNLPNILTFIRIILVLPLLICLFLDGLAPKIIALVCFVVASITDFIDGRLARKNNQVTKLGAFFDPLADKMLINLTLLALVCQGIIPFFMLAIILVRDFAADGLRMMAAGEGVTLAAAMSGKIKTTVQMITVISILFNRILENDILTNINTVLLYIVLALTIYSGLEYIIKGWKLITK